MEISAHEESKPKRKKEAFCKKANTYLNSVSDKPRLWWAKEWT